MGKLLRRREIGPSFRSFCSARPCASPLRGCRENSFPTNFSLNSHHYSPEMIEKLTSITHSPRYDSLCHTAS